MSRYSIIEGAAVTARDIEQARRLDQMVYDEEYHVPQRQCVAWNRRNNRIYTMVRDNRTDQIVAYINISPVTEEYYKKIASGSFLDTYLPPEAIVEYALPDLYDLYFSSVVVHPDYQNSSIFVLLFNAVARKFLTLGEEGILIRRMVADAVSERGEKFCRLFGMQKKKTSDHHSRIYEVQMLPPEFHVSSQATRELYRYYCSKAEELGMECLEQAGTEGGFEGGQTAAEQAPRAEHCVFISHSSQQAAEAKRVCEYLESQGIPCWIAPRNIKPGGNYATQIVRAIRSCSALVLLASENTNVSGHVSNEVSLAFDSKKTIIPFKLEDVAFSDEYLYFLGRKHWIDAFQEFDKGLEMLLATLRQSLSGADGAHPQPVRPHPEKGALRNLPVEEEQGQKTLSRREIAALLLEKVKKFSYSLVERCAAPEDRRKFEEQAERMFAHTVAVYHNGRRYEAQGDVIGCFTGCIGALGENGGISVSGLPGSAKNMLLQLAFFRMTEDFAEGRSNLLPCYLSVNYYEKADYESEDVAEQMKARIQEEMDPFLHYLSTDPLAEPVVFVDAVREHIIAQVSPENVLHEVLRPLKRYRRVVSIDRGLIKNKTRLKKIISIMGSADGWSFQTRPVELADRESALEVIDSILTMYRSEGFSAEDVWQTLKSLRYAEMDIFLVRMVVQEMQNAFHGPALSTVEMYEKMALSELEGDEEALLEIAREMYHYMFDDSLLTERVEYRGNQWALVHKHSSYMEFLVAYYFARRIQEIPTAEDADFFRTMLTSMEGNFLVQILRENYGLQEDLYQFITQNYESFDIYQKSNGAYWLGRITAKNLVPSAVDFLMEQFSLLKPEVKGNCRFERSNLDRHFLFRAVCTALLFHGQARIMDEYLCMIIINDAANAINRGATVEYYGDTYQMAANDSYYLDTDHRLGDRAIKALCHRVENSIFRKDGKFPESNLVTLVTMLQVRLQDPPERCFAGLRGHIEKALGYIEAYQLRPKYVASNKIEFFLASVQDDFRAYLSGGDFNISQQIYNRYRGIKDVKRLQWVSRDIEDPESVSEHTYSAWLMAMLFLPETLSDPGYNKREVLDMLLIHDLAEAEIGDRRLSLDEPNRDLKEQNAVLRKLFVKGTYPGIANLTYYYNVWTGYYNDANINAKIARDVNVLQTVYTFCEYYIRYPDHFEKDDVARWEQNQAKLTTEIGFALWDQLIRDNTAYRNIFQ